MTIAEQDQAQRQLESDVEARARERERKAGIVEVCGRADVLTNTDPSVGGGNDDATRTRMRSGLV